MLYKLNWHKKHRTYNNEYCFCINSILTRRKLKVTSSIRCWSRGLLHSEMLLLMSHSSAWSGGTYRRSESRNAWVSACRRFSFCCSWWLRLSRSRVMCTYTSRCCGSHPHPSCSCWEANVWIPGCCWRYSPITNRILS